MKSKGEYKSKYEIGDLVIVKSFERDVEYGKGYPGWSRRMDNLVGKQLKIDNVISVNYYTPYEILYTIGGFNWPESFVELVETDKYTKIKNFERNMKKAINLIDTLIINHCKV